MSPVTLRPLGSDAIDGLAHIIEVSEAEGFRFLSRLRDEYLSGVNPFDRPGEILLGGYQGSCLNCIGGLNVDPYSSDPRTGRLRHVYVVPAARRQGVGRALVGALMEQAAKHFDELVLRTHSLVAARFYESLGFIPSAGGAFTHRQHVRNFGKRSGLR